MSQKTKLPLSKKRKLEDVSNPTSKPPGKATQSLSDLIDATQQQADQLEILEKPIKPSGSKLDRTSKVVVSDSEESLGLEDSCDMSGEEALKEDIYREECKDFLEIHGKALFQVAFLAWQAQQAKREQKWATQPPSQGGQGFGTRNKR